jgi:Spy/CpxP family protein refolding chaperone
VSAAAADGPFARRSPRRRLVAALLAVSLALNLFFIAGAVWTDINPPPQTVGFDQRFRAMAAQLALSPQQQVAFARYEAAMRSGREALHRQVRPLIDAVRQEIAKPQPDVGRIRQLLDEAAVAHRAFQRQAVTATLAFVATLTPAQRSTFVAIERQRWERRPHRR